MTSPTESAERLLLVDDDEEVVWALGRCLTHAGYSVTTCDDGAKALELIDDAEFDIVVTDVQMPGLNGLSLLEWIRNHRPLTRVVVITAYVSDSVKTVAASKGAYMFLAKPVDPQLLVEVLRGPEIGGQFSGSIDGLDFFDYLQLVLMSRRQHQFELHDGKGRKCRIWIRDGAVVHAATESASGVDALAECAGYERGQFVMLPWQEPDRQTIAMPANHLLLEVARLRDESSSREIEADIERPTEDRARIHLERALLSHACIQRALVLEESGRSLADVGTGDGLPSRLVEILNEIHRTYPRAGLRRVFFEDGSGIVVSQGLPRGRSLVVATANGTSAGAASVQAARLAQILAEVEF